MAVAASLALLPALGASRLGWQPTQLGALALGALAVSLAARWPAGIGCALVLLGGEYAVGVLLDGDGIDPAAPLFGAGLLLAAELSYWSLEPAPARARADRAIVTRRLLALSVLALGSVCLGTLALVAASATAGGGLVGKAIGIAAAAAALALVGGLALRARPPAEPG